MTFIIGLIAGFFLAFIVMAAMEYSKILFSKKPCDEGLAQVRLNSGNKWCDK